jgi:sucrose-6-phosphate hydrolase SacC (GH32 family)
MKHTLTLLALLLAPLSTLHAADDIVIADFEGADYGAWTVSGKSFGTTPAHADLPRQGPVSGFEGKGLANSFHDGEKAQGELLSPEFSIERGFINFLIGGGQLPGQVFVALMVDGKAVRGATGANAKKLDWANWDVKDLIGKKAQFRIADRSEGAFGYILVDQIVQSDTPRGKTQTDVKTAKEWVISASEFYNESFRPQFHFSSDKGWLNDPNGMVYYQGEYHLSFQHGLIWGHAVSKDLLHWEQGPNIITGDAMGAIFSGSSVVDWNNTAGFQQGDEKTIVAIYTSWKTKETASQCLAYSNDRGRTYTKYSDNPVIKTIAPGNRDPKVIWHEPTKRWIMALFLDGARPNFALLSSPNLKEWTQIQSFNCEGGIECPDFFPLAVTGKPGITKWVYTNGNGNYLVGDFDGTTFKFEGKSQKGDFGLNTYAAQTFSDIPEKDGRRIQIAWMRRASYPGMPFSQQMSFPCALTLREEAGILSLFRYPVSEIESLRVKSLLSLKDKPLAPDTNPLAAVKGDLFDIDAEFALGDAKEIVFTIRGQTVRYDATKRMLEVIDTKAPLAPAGDRVKLRILVDRTSIEVFGNDGQISSTNAFVADPDLKDLSLTAVGGNAKIVKLDVYELKSVWNSK